MPPASTSFLFSLRAIKTYIALFGIKRVFGDGWGGIVVKIQIQYPKIFSYKYSLSSSHIHYFIIASLGLL